MKISVVKYRPLEKIYSTTDSAIGLVKRDMIWGELSLYDENGATRKTQQMLKTYEKNMLRFEMEC